MGDCVKRLTEVPEVAPPLTSDTVMPPQKAISWSAGIVLGGGDDMLTISSPISLSSMRLNFQNDLPHDFLRHTEIKLIVGSSWAILSTLLKYGNDSAFFFSSYQGLLLTAMTFPT